MIKLDYYPHTGNNSATMEKLLNSENVKSALQAKGWTQKDLAAQLDVTPQAITNWLKGIDFPRPDKLLKLATALKLTFSALVVSSSEDQPVIAFRKKGAAKTTDEHITKAIAMGSLLKPLVPFLPGVNALRSTIANPSTSYEALQAIAKEIRQRIGLGAKAVLGYEHLIEQFYVNGAVIAPVMWGEKRNHKNALHILLPKEQITFIFLNLDTRLEDFKFWMAHELAHVYTPDLAGTEAGEDFADALAGALLFPQAIAEAAYVATQKQVDSNGELKVLKRYASEYSISLFSVFSEVERFSKTHRLPGLRCAEKDVHAIRNTERGKLISEILFDPLPPMPAEYIAATANTFRSAFFAALKAMIKANGVGSGYVQQVMDISMQDAASLVKELSD
ncbi:XRE family transcriptional regulator [Limnobacter humi]|uniref:XRE family transcriptional regulator n=1 Tax=Limnobacter humi TaxID=1778671 RepID=A0ABT1WFD9_9BURK|nr:XRE family transcriptional regulator [Limnobacter humi]MCQ8895613.1 XRE family transcriptional regulator [Limnobacter humi]